MKLLILIPIILFNIFGCNCERDFLKFISNGKHVVLCATDILDIDRESNILTLSKKASNRLSKLNIENLQVFVLDIEDNWIKVDLVDIRNSNINFNPIIYTNKNEFLFYSENQLVIRGDVWFSIVEYLKR